jgi:pyridoxine 5-phosphate synthase
LYINIDHIATLRQARRGTEPDPTTGARIALAAGAHGITGHLREDRRHLIDSDLAPLRALPAPFNLEMACTDEMLGIAESLSPLQVTLVPERREEVTTEGGLDVARAQHALTTACTRLRAAGIRTALFIDADADSIARSRDCGADAVELHTGTYAHHPHEPGTLAALQRGATLAAAAGLAVHAGHGLTVPNVGPVAAIPEVEELNIGHAIISQAVFVGLDVAVRDMLAAMSAARAR